MKTCPYCAEDIRDQALKCKHCGSWIVNPPPAEAKTSGGSWFSMPSGPSGRRLYKSRDKMVDGVCAGLANYLGVDPTWVRLAWAAAIFLGGVGVVLYFIFMIVVPQEPDMSKPAPPVSAQDLP